MIYGSVCSGIEAATVAWEPLGWKAAWYSEIEAFPSAVLAHHYPNTPNLGDMTKFKEWPDANINVLVGGTPCQSFSIAGLRKGLTDPRGSLMLTFGAITGRYRPLWVVWENVPGVLSSNGGKDFGTFLGMLAELGYGFSYRVLDAQYAGVPQRRRRVFVVGYFGDWRPAAAVLFERHSLQRHTPPSRQTGEEIAASLASSSGGCNDPNRAGAFIHSIGIDEECNASVEQFGPLLRGGQGGTRQAVAIGVGENPELAHCLRSGANKADKHESTTYICMETGQASAGIGIGIGTTLNCNHEAPIIAIQDGRGMDKKQNGKGFSEDGTAYTLDGVSQQAIAFQTKDNGRDAAVEISPTILNQTTGVGSTVRRLTPKECERLQGFPDGHTAIPWRGKKSEDCPDGPRYKALGNSMAVPCMVRIGQRIELVSKLLSAK